MKDKAIHDAMDSIENRVRDVYNQGYSDGLADGNINSGLLADRVREAYNNGLDDAWECVRKMERILWSDTLKPIFGEEDYYTLVTKHDAKYCMQKLKEYEEQQKQIRECKTCNNSDDGKCAGTEECHLCMWDSQYEPKHPEEKTDKSCESCRFVELEEHEFPCSVCSASHTFRWEPQKVN